MLSNALIYFDFLEGKATLVESDKEAEIYLKSLQFSQSFDSLLSLDIELGIYEPSE